MCVCVGVSCWVCYPRVHTLQSCGRLKWGNIRRGEHKWNVNWAWYIDPVLTVCVGRLSRVFSLCIVLIIRRKGMGTSASPGCSFLLVLLGVFQACGCQDIELFSPYACQILWYLFFFFSNTEGINASGLSFLSYLLRSNTTTSVRDSSLSWRSWFTVQIILYVSRAVIFNLPHATATSCRSNLRRPRPSHERTLERVSRISEPGWNTERDSCSHSKKPITLKLAALITLEINPKQSLQEIKSFRWCTLLQTVQTLSSFYRFICGCSSRLL